MNMEAGMAVDKLCLQLLLLGFCVSLTNGVRLPVCTSDKVSVDETSNTVVTCVQIDAQHEVTWSLKAGGSQDDVILGTCPPQGSCQQGNRYSLTRTSTESTVTITPSADIRSLNSYRIQCSDPSGAKSCAMATFYPAVVPSQNCHVETRSGSWTFGGSCNITKTFSSSNTYQCHVYRGTSQTSQPTPVITLGYTPQSHSDSNYRTGSCSFTSNFTSLVPDLTTRQDYYFRIDVYPGPTQRVVGPVKIQKPVSPSLRCPDIVAENTTLTCTCSTTNIGQPAGRLVWSRVSGGDIKEGQYDVSTLALPPQTLTRGDHGVTKFRCDVKWASGTYQDVYTANVGFPPSQTTVTVNSASPGQSVEVSENDPVTFTCTAVGGNPQSNLTLSDTTSTISTGSSPLTHSLGKAQCQHSGRYTCSATNGLGPHVTSSTTLYVRCQPQSAGKIKALNFINDRVETSFSVTGYPAPDLTFKYVGQSINTTDDPTNLPSGITLNGSCKAQDSNVNRFTCTITVYNVTSDDAAGFYQVTLTNEAGAAQVRFEVQYKGPVPPSSSGSLTGNGAKIAGGVLGGCAVIAAIAAFIWYKRRRRKRSKEEHSSSETADRREKRPGRNSYHEMEEPSPDPEAQPRPLSFAPMAVYAEVDKKTKKPKQTTEAEANGGPPADVYAEVDKTKKKTPAKKPADKAKKDKTKNKGASEAAHVYGNVEDIKQGKGAKPKKTAPPAKADNSSGKTVNPDGLIYTTVNLAQKPTSGKTPPKKSEEDHVIYSEVKTS